MSKVSEAKERMGYITNPVAPVCMNCASYSSETVADEYGFFEEKNKRCTKGNFVVKKMAICNEYEQRK